MFTAWLLKVCVEVNGSKLKVRLFHSQAKFTTTKIQENGSANDTFLIECEGIGLKGQH